MKNLTENNRLIAEFMQPSFNGFGIYDFNGAFYKLNELRFHNSWNWIMPVVEQIESIGYDVTIKGIICKVNEILNDEPIVSFVLGDKSRKLELVYSTIVEFIEFYNNKND